MKTYGKAKGQTIALFVLGLIALVAFVGLALDGGLAYATRREMQNSADAASMAGARQLTMNNDRGLLYDHIREYSIYRNGADRFTATFYTEGNGRPQLGTFPGTRPSGSAPGDAVGVCVTSENTYETAFVQVIGIPSLTISAEACAAASGECPSPGSALYAGGDCGRDLGTYALKWSGSGSTIEGIVHSNWNVNVSGSNNTFGRTEHGCPNPALESCWKNSGSGNVLNPAYVAPGPVPYADYYRESQYWDAITCPSPPGGCVARPRGQIAEIAHGNGGYLANLTTSDIDVEVANCPGLCYYPNTNKVTVKRGSWPVNMERQITIVAPRALIVLGDSDLRLAPYIDDLLFLTNRTGSAVPKDKCTVPVVELGGSNNNLTGIVYAPNGLIKIAGSGTYSFQGSLIGYAIDISGGNLVVTYAPDMCPIYGRVTQGRLRRP